MANVYSAQNVASFFIYELNEVYLFVNSFSIQQLLEQVDRKWKQSFGHSAYIEKSHCMDTSGYYVREVYETYSEYGNKHISLPASEWFLKYGEFQLIYRTYGVPAFTEEEKQIIIEVVDNYRTTTFDAGNIAV